MKDKCVILEGGGLRCSFTAGILDFLLEHNYNFERVIGVSAGACAGASFISKQPWRNYVVNVVHPSHKQYMGMRHFFKKRNYFNMDFIFGDIPEWIYPFDTETFMKNPTQFDIAATSLEDGSLKIIGKEEIKEFGILNCLQASSSIPLISTPVPLGNKIYYDGGVADSIPVNYALSKHKKAFLILTQPRGYRKKAPKFPGFIRFVFRKHRAFAEALISRSVVYNATLELCDKLEAEGKLFILAPKAGSKIKRIEKDIVVRDMTYRRGYSLMQKEFDNLKKFLGK